MAAGRRHPRSDRCAMSGWNLADIWRRPAPRSPTRRSPSRARGRSTWREADRRAEGLASYLLDSGAGHQGKVAQYLYNCPEYLETTSPRSRRGSSPVNTNYRYGRRRDRLPVRQRRRRGGGVPRRASPSWSSSVRAPAAEGASAGRGSTTAPAPCPDWAVDLRRRGRQPGARGRTVAPWGRSGDDLLLLYTGGTTGMPKGVMWRQDDLFNVLGGRRQRTVLGESTRLAEVDELASAEPGPVDLLVACPLMHGTGQFSAFITLNLGGSVVTLPSRHFDALELLARVERSKVNRSSSSATPSPGRCSRRSTPSPAAGTCRRSASMIVVGRDVEPGEQGRACSPHARRPDLSTRFGSSEAVGMGASVSAAGAAAQTATFMLGPNCAVFTDDGRRVEPGSGERGLVAVARLHPARLLQGRGEDGADVPHRSRASAGACPATGPRSNADGTAHAARPRLGVHQHRRREGLPRRGRGGAQDPPGGSRRGGRRPARRALRRDDLRRGRARPARRDLDARTSSIDHVPRAPRRATRRRASSSSSTPSAALRTARSTTSSSAMTPSPT